LEDIVLKSLLKCKLYTYSTRFKPKSVGSNLLRLEKPRYFVLGKTASQLQLNLLECFSTSGKRFT